MPSRRKVRNPLGLAVMSYLLQRPMHPYELSRTLREHGDDRSIRFNHGSLYMVVGQLERAGFIAAQETTREGQRPERTVYALTAAGREEHATWLRALIAEPEHEYPGFVAALSLIAALPPADVVELLTKRQRRLEALRDEAAEVIATTTAHGVHPLFLIEEEYRVAQLETEIAFVDSFLGRIKGARSPWRKAWDNAREQFGSESKR